MGLSYGWQKFHGAIHSLTSELPLRKRLNHAIASNIYHLSPDEDLPAEIVDDFKQLISFVTSEKAEGDEGTITATLNSLSDEQLSNLVERIISMHDTICREYGKTRTD